MHQLDMPMDYHVHGAHARTLTLEIHVKAATNIAELKGCFVDDMSSLILRQSYHQDFDRALFHLRPTRH